MYRPTAPGALPVHCHVCLTKSLTSRRSPRYDRQNWPGSSARQGQTPLCRVSEDQLQTIPRLEFLDVRVSPLSVRLSRPSHSCEGTCKGTATTDPTPAVPHMSTFGFSNILLHSLASETSVFETSVFETSVLHGDREARQEKRKGIYSSQLIYDEEHAARKNVSPTFWKSSPPGKKHRAEARFQTMADIFKKAGKQGLQHLSTITARHLTDILH